MIFIKQITDWSYPSYTCEQKPGRGCNCSTSVTFPYEILKWLSTGNHTRIVTFPSHMHQFKFTYMKIKTRRGDLFMDSQEMDEKGGISKPDVLALGPLQLQNLLYKSWSTFSNTFLPFKATHTFTCWEHDFCSGL